MGARAARRYPYSGGVATYLDAILTRHRAAAAADRRDEGVLARSAEKAAETMPLRDFRAALTSPGLAVIAEVKRRSPSLGDLAPQLDPAALAVEYAAGGAACLSVLTDAESFGGSAHDLRAARAAVDLPVLRKDFTVCAADVFDARIMGADAVLLIAAALSPDELREFGALVNRLGMTPLFEVHDRSELEIVLSAGATVVGVNQRDLVTFEVDRHRAVELAAEIPPGIVKVAESGVGGPDDARVLAQAGYDAVLVGQSLVSSVDPAVAVKALVAACS